MYIELFFGILLLFIQVNSEELEELKECTIEYSIYRRDRGHCQTLQGGRNVCISLNRLDPNNIDCN